MATRTLTDLIKSLPQASSLAGLSMICADSSGNLKKREDLINGIAEDLDNMPNLTGLWMVGDRTLNIPPNAKGTTTLLLFQWAYMGLVRGQVLIGCWQSEILYRGYPKGNDTRVWRNVAFQD